MTKTSRVVRVPFYDEWVGALLRGDCAVVSGLPSDATMERFYHDPLRDRFIAIVSSEEFDHVAEGEKIPERTLTVKPADIGDNEESNNDV